MRWSKAFIPTLRDAPADADAPSHKLLVRAGYIRQLMAGHYSLLPLAYKVRQNIIDVIREEIDGIGGQEFLLPTMHPAEVWRQTGRWDSVDVLFKMQDQRGQDIALGATHEEIFTLISNELQSYKDLPQLWYQFQTKYRDEARPKSGVLRVREFTMKDSYSFDIDQAGLDHIFEQHRLAYLRIFERLGIPAVPVMASSGAMGGNSSVEFMSATNSGEDDVVHCTGCGYAANAEKAASVIETVADEPVAGQPERFDTPGVTTIQDLADFPGGAAADRQIKTLVYMVGEQVTLVLLRGDHELVEQKLIDATGASAVRPAHVDEIKAALGASPGSLGAVGVTNLPVLADESLRGRTSMTTGANVDGVHLRNVDVARDIAVGHWANLRRVMPGEACVECGQALQIMKAVEIGHIFKLGDHYTKKMNVTVLGREGKPVIPLMGSYGIGVERAMGAIVEKHHDDKGIVWPISVAPYKAAIVPLAVHDEESMRVAEDLYEAMTANGVDVILDDRDARPGVKLADVELTGIPFRITIGKRGLANGVVELTARASGATSEVAVPDAAAALLAAVSQ